MRKIFFLFVLFTSFGLSLIFFRPSNSISNSSFIKNKEEEEKYLKKKEQTAIERNEYFFMLLRDPGTNSIPENIREKEIAFASTLPKSEERLAKGLNAHEFNWKEAGPFDVGGRTRALVVDISNNNTIIAGGVSGGIWKSTDKGVTWSFKSSKSSILSVTSIAQDTRPGFQNIWYAVGGELDGNSAMARGGNAFFYGGGFYRSTDNGESWSLVKYNNSLYNPNGTSFNSIFSVSSKVLVSPTTGSVFVASNSSAIFKSTDGGSTWIYPPALGKLNDHYYVDIIVNKNGVLVASLSQKGWSGTGQTSVPGIYKSVDDGVYWQSITPSEFPTEYYRTVMAFGTSNPNVVYTLTNTGNKIGSTKKDDVRLFKINISTGTANELTVNLPDFSPSSRSYIDTQVNYNMAIAVHPNDENIVFIAGTSLFRSLDGFATKPTNQKINWIGGYNPTTFYYPQLHPDIHTIVFDQESTPGIWVGHDGGISYAQDATVTNYDTYFPWYDRDNLYNVTQYYTMAISPTSGDTRIFGGTQDNGTPLFRWNGTNATSSRDATSSDGSYAYIGSQTLNGKIYSYGSTQNGVVIRFGTDSNGDIDRTDWSVITPSGAAGKKFINPYTVDPDNENYMYYIAGNILWRNSSLSSIPEHNQDSTSQGWSSINLQIPAGYSFSTIAVSRTPASILYLAASSSTGQPKIYKMDNSKTANTATDITSNLNASTGSYIHGIAINPDDANEVLVVISNYYVRSLWYTNNGGLSWSDVEGNISLPSIRSATILPISGGSKVYLIATSVGVYSTSQMNGASTVWIQEGHNVIGNVVVEYITSRKSDGKIVAATHGRGAFVGTYILTGVENENNLPTSFRLEQNYPNPFNPSTNISYRLQGTSYTTLKVYDMLGREVATLVNKEQPAGTYQIVWNGTDNFGNKVTSGVYIYRIQAGSFSQTKKLVLMK